MKILISGSNGIIGRQLIRDLYEFYPNAQFIELNRSISKLEVNPRIISLNINLLSAKDKELEDILNKYKPRLFFHLAWETSHGEYLNSSYNIEWCEKTILLIKYFYKYGGEKFIGLGSSIEYDWKSSNCFSVNNTPLNGNNYLYGTSKLNVYNFLSSMSGNSYLWCRVFFVFGPGQQKTRLIPQIIKNVISQKGELLINTNLVRDYLSTFEISKQILLMSQSNFSGPLNICSGKGKSIGEIVKLIEDIIGRRAIISDKKFDDKFEVQILCGCQKEILDYFPDYEYDKKKLTKDLRTTVNYYLEEYNK